MKISTRNRNGFKVSHQFFKKMTTYRGDFNFEKCKIQTKKLREIDSRTFIAYFVINITMFIDKRMY